MRLAAAVLAMTLCATGCSTIIGRGDWDPFRTQAESRLHVLVLNETLGSVTVQALAAGRRVNLGTIEGSQRNSFAIPWSGPQDLRFQIEILGGQTHTTNSTYVRPGDQVEVRVRDPVQRSLVNR